MAKPKPDLRELGRTGLSRFGGFISEEWLPELSGSKGALVYEKMVTNDGTVGSMAFAVQMLCRRVPWRADGNVRTSTGKEAIAFLDSCLYDMSASWADTVADILSMLWFGWSFHETNFKRCLGTDQTDPLKYSQYDDGMIRWRNLPIRSQKSLFQWQYNEETGELEGIWQQPAPNYDLRYIPLEKGLLFRTAPSRDNPEGQSLLRSAYRAWYMKTNLEDIEAIGLERDLAGLPMLYVPQDVLDQKTDAAKTAYARALKLVTNIRQDRQMGILLPSDADANGNRSYELKLLSSGGVRQFNTSQIISRYDSRIAMTVMADFLLLGQGRTGSYALASTKTDLFTTAITAILDSICDTFNTTAIPRLCALNGIDPEDYPWLAHGDIKVPDLQALGSFINNLTWAGAKLFPDRNLLDHLLGLANLPPSQYVEVKEGQAALDSALPPAPATAEQAASQEEVNAILNQEAAQT